MYRACELKDQTYKKTRTLQFSEIGPVQFSWPRGVAENWFTKPGFWEHFVSFFPRKRSKTQSSLNFLQSGPQKFSESNFSGLAPIRRVLSKKNFPNAVGCPFPKETVRHYLVTSFPLDCFALTADYLMLILAMHSGFTSLGVLRMNKTVRLVRVLRIIRIARLSKAQHWARLSPKLPPFFGFPPFPLSTTKTISVSEM